jgi:hypothetical protein
MKSKEKIVRWDAHGAATPELRIIISPRLEIMIGKPSADQYTNNISYLIALLNLLIPMMPPSRHGLSLNR